MTDNHIIQGLWIGPRLTVMEQLCIRSFLANGHDFHLYTYGQVEGIPEGTTVKDANEILPFSDKFRHVQQFADCFRWKLLFERGGWWVDLDVVCLRPHDIPEEYVFPDGLLCVGQNRVNNSNVKAPAGSPIMKHCWEACQKVNPNSMEYGGAGPLILANAIEKFGLQRYIFPTWAFLFVPYFEFTRLLKGPTPLPPDAYAVHLYNEMWKGSGYSKEAQHPSECVYERLKRRYLDSSPDHVIQSLWVGPGLSTMERLSVNSYLFHGHEFRLYTYGKVEGVPKGTVIRDANEVVPESDIQRFQNLANFSDWFRYHLLLKEGGWWVDMDTVCLRPFSFKDDHVFVEQHANAKSPDHIHSGWMKAPRNSHIMQWCIDKCWQMDWKKIQWSDIGPNLITRAVNEFSMSFQPSHLFNPTNSTKSLVDGTAHIPKEACSVHLGHSAWCGHWANEKKLDVDAAYPYDCAYERLKRAYLPVPRKNILIAVITCKQTNARARALRETWVPLAEYAGYDVEMFEGSRVGVKDEYLSLPQKTKAVCNWALEHRYRRMLKCDDDTYLRVDRLVPAETDYAGIYIPPNDLGYPKLDIPAFPKGTIKHSYLSGGCYWLSERSMRILGEAPFYGDWAEDRWVGQTLGKAGIVPQTLPGYNYTGWNTVQQRGVTLQQQLAGDFVALTQLPSPAQIVECHRTLDEISLRQPAAPAKSLPRQLPGTTHAFIPPQFVRPAAKPGSQWQEETLGIKVRHAINRGFKVAAICPFGSDYHMELRKAFPSHFEEVVDTPEGKKVLFLVK